MVSKAKLDYTQNVISRSQVASKPMPDYGDTTQMGLKTLNHDLASLYQHSDGNAMYTHKPYLGPC